MLNLAPFREALRGVRSESGERNAIQRVLDASGHRSLPSSERTTLADGRTARVYLWRDVGGTGCAVALISGPEVVGDVRVLYPHSGGSKGSLFIPASGRHPALTDAKQARSNSGAGGFEALKREVAGTASEQGQVNAVARALASHGYAKAGHPEVSTTSVDRSTFRIYLWRDTPFGDHLVLSTGPSFEPALALASQIPAEPGVGFYVRALVDEHPRTLAGASRAAARAMPKPTPAAEVAAEKTARKTRIPKAKIVEAAAAVAEAESAPTVTVAHVEAVEEAAGNGWMPSARLTDAQAVARDIARARGRERARSDDERQIKAVADEAATTVRRMLLAEGGSTSKAAQSRAAGVVAEARAEIRRMISRKSPARQHDLRMIEDGLVAEFTRILTLADAEETAKVAARAAREAEAEAGSMRVTPEKVYDALIQRGIPASAAGKSMHALTALITKTARVTVEPGSDADLLRPDNKNSRAVFEQFTGQTLPKGVKATEDFVLAWLGGAPVPAAKAPRAPKAAAPAKPAIDAAAAAREMQEMIAALRAMRGA